jgi:murein DD-endopeptidase MepM/ murein hydrolase activator NlpD
MVPVALSSWGIMAQQKVAIRLGTEGKGDVVRDFADIGAAGDAAATRAARSFGKASEDIESAVRRQAAAADKLAAIMPQTPMQARVNMAVGTGASLDQGSARVSAQNFRELIAEQERYAAGAAALRAQIDPVWAAQQRFNGEMAEARALISNNAITLDDYSKKLWIEQQALNGVTQAHGRANGATGAMRAGLQQAGFQVQDFFVQWQMGTPVLRAFSQQAPQLIGNLQMMTSGAEQGGGKFAKFAQILSGPWGVALGVAIPVAGMLAEKLFEDGKASEEAAKGAKKHQDAIEALSKAMRDSIQTAEDRARASYVTAEGYRQEALQAEKANVAQIEKQKRQLEIQQTRNKWGPQDQNDTGALEAARIAGEIKRLETALADARARVAERTADATIARGNYQGTIIDQMMDPRGRINRTYNRQRNEAIEAGKSADAIARIERARDGEIAKLEATEKALRSHAQALTKFMMPVEGPVTSGFGARKAPTAGASTNHPAIDFGVPIGTQVKAPAMGVVEAIGYSESLGKYIVINHGGGTKTRYGHLSDNAIVTRGETVQQGETIGRTGNTGRSTGPHLDYQVMVNGKPVDPRKGMFPTDGAGVEIAAGQRASKDDDRDKDAAIRKALEQERAVNEALGSFPVGKIANDNLKDEGERLQEITAFMAQQRADTSAGTILLNTEWEMRGRTREEIAKAVELQRYALDLQRRMPAATAEQIKELVDAKKAQMDYAEQIDKSRVMLDTMRQTGESAFDRIFDPSSSESWKDRTLGALRDVLNEMFRMAALNPLKNMLFGSGLPTAGGGLFGSLLGSIGIGGGSGLAGAQGFAGYGLTAAPSFSAIGNEYTPAGAMWVGENGPEQIIMPRGAKVMTASDSRRAAGGGGGAPVTYAPVYQIDATGADQAAIARLERKLDSIDRSFEGRVIDTVQEGKDRMILRNGY